MAEDEATDDRLVWMDLEMTGLDPDRERIIEIAALITEADLTIVTEGPDLVVHQPDSLLEAMDDWNREHHGESGLTERVRASTIDEAEAERQVLAFVAAHCGERSAPLCGNSVHQDRRFLSRYMRELDDFLHYRIVDVSTVKELARRWYPTEFEARPKKVGRHRALDDIKESLEELRWYRENVFR